MYAQLPEEFTTKGIEQVLDISHHAAENQITRWIQSGYIVRIAQEKYKKLITQII